MKPKDQPKTTCDCASYRPLMNYDDIKEYIAKREAIASTLIEIAEYEGHQPKLQLYRCRVCNQVWQSAFDELFRITTRYYFKVPDISIEDWLKEPFVQPGLLIAYASEIAKIPKDTTERQCKKEGCTQYAIKYSVLCHEHHIENLASVNAFFKKPTGRLFPPYDKLLIP